MIEADISRAIYSAIADAAASITPKLPVQFPLRTFTKPKDNRYIEVVQIVNNRANEFWGDGRTYQGSVRLIVHWTNDDTGEIPMKLYAGELAKLIPKGSILHNGDASVLIYDHMDMSSVIVEGADVMVPLTLRYRDFQVASAA